MKKAISKIKTESEFWEFADVWYQRTKNLAAYRNNESNPIGKRIQAAKLWINMYARMMAVSEIAKNISMRVPEGLREKYKKGHP